MSLTEKNNGFDVTNPEASNPNTPEMEMFFDYLGETLKVLEGYKDALRTDHQLLDLGFIYEKSLSLLEEVIKQIDQMCTMIDEWLDRPASMNVVQILDSNSKSIIIRLQNTQECLQPLPENREQARPQLKIEFVSGMGGVSFENEIMAQSYRPRGKTSSFSASPEQVLDESYRRSEADFNLRIGIEYLFKNLDTGLLKCDRGPTVEFSALVGGGVIARIIYFVGFTPHYYGPVDIGINREDMNSLRSDFLKPDGLFKQIKVNFEKNQTNKSKTR